MKVLLQNVLHWIHFRLNQFKWTVYIKNKFVLCVIFNFEQDFYLIEKK